MTQPEASRRKGGWGLGGGSTRSLIGKIALLSVVAATAVFLAIPLVAQQDWVLLGVVIATTVAIFLVYLQPWQVPLKYIVPGTIFLIAFQVIPVFGTAATSVTNFGDGHRGTKADAVASIESSTVERVPESAAYVLTIATEGDPATGRSSSSCTTRPRRPSSAATPPGCRPLPDAVLTPAGKVKEAPGLTILTTGQAGFAIRGGPGVRRPH